jgi:Protein of unknown function (DUF1579)
MKRTAFVIFSLTAVLAATTAYAQETPAPGSEVGKLSYFAGNWTSDATIAPGPWGAGGKFTDTAQVEWMKGNFFLVDHSDFSMPAELGGSGTSMQVIGYDSETGNYTEERFDSAGHHVSLTGKLAGSTWTWTGNANYGGMPMQVRFTITVVSPTSYTSKYEISADGGTTWMPFWEGKATKQ